MVGGRDAAPAAEPPVDDDALVLVGSSRLTRCRCDVERAARFERAPFGWKPNVPPTTPSPRASSAAGPIPPAPAPLLEQPARFERATSALATRSSTAELRLRERMSVVGAVVMVFGWIIAAIPAVCKKKKIQRHE